MEFCGLPIKFLNVRLDTHLSWWKKGVVYGISLKIVFFFSFSEDNASNSAIIFLNWTVFENCSANVVAMAPLSVSASVLEDKDEKDYYSAVQQQTDCFIQLMHSLNDLKLDMVNRHGPLPRVGTLGQLLNCSARASLLWLPLMDVPPPPKSMVRAGLAPKGVQAWLVYSSTKVLTDVPRSAHQLFLLTPQVE